MSASGLDSALVNSERLPRPTVMPGLPGIHAFPPPSLFQACRGRGVDSSVGCGLANGVDGRDEPGQDDTASSVASSA
jgi:hypothetical protein